jgi:hypothetical protein
MLFIVPHSSIRDEQLSPSVKGYFAATCFDARLSPVTFTSTDGSVSQNRSSRYFKLEPAVRRELTRHPVCDRPEVPFCFRLKLDMSGEGLYPGVLEREATSTYRADEFDGTHAVRLLGKDEIVTHRMLSRLDVAQDRVARLSFV